MDWIHRCLIVPDALVAQARTLAESLAGPSGAGMWTTGLSADGTSPATHWISAGLIDKPFADLLSSPDALSVAAGVPLADTQALLDACDVSEDDAFTAMDRLGLKLVTE